MTYQQARRELETLVEELERPDADLGQIASKVKRALDRCPIAGITCARYVNAETTLDAYEKE